MARKLRPRKGTTGQNNAYTGLSAEITIDTTKNTIVVHDGVTVGGHPLTTAAETTTAISDHVAAADPHTGYALESTIGVANGIASLDGTGKVPSAQLPSYVDDVLEYTNLAALPATGETGKIYVALDTSKTYRWSGSAYVVVGAAGDLFITYADAFADVVLSGLVFPTSATLTSTMSSGVAEVIGTRVVVPATENTFTASQDTYVDLSNAGVLTYVGVANTILIEDCEDTWNESVDADATVSVVADVAAGQTLTNSNKIVVAATAVAGDVLATEAIASLNLSTATAARWWIKSSIATAAGDLHLLLGETAIVTTANAAEILAVPALTANTWTQVQVDFAGATTARDAIISVGLRYTVDIGACDLFIDDVQGIIPAPAAPAVTANSLRLQKVVTSSTAVTSVVQIASRELTANRNISVPAPTLGGHATNKDFVSAELSAHNAAADPHPQYNNVFQYANLAAFPASGADATLYIAVDTSRLYRWDGAAYVFVGGLDAIPTMTMLGNNTGGSAVPTALTKTDVQTLLDIGWVTQSRSVAAPNATVPVHALTAVGAETNIDVLLGPKGSGAIVAHVPDSTATGGDKRGAGATDLQRSRAISSQVASGTEATIGGGKDNKASNFHSTVGGGDTNAASGIKSTVGGGEANAASGGRSTVGGGQLNSATAEFATVPGGQGNVADARGSQSGGMEAHSQGRIGSAVHGSGKITTVGDVQCARMVLRAQTTDATATVLRSNTAVESATNGYFLETFQLATIKGRVVARNPAALVNWAIWEFTANIYKDSTAGSTILTAAVTPTLLSSGGTGGNWVLSVTANTTHGTLRVEGTGEAGKTVSWGCALDGLEVRDID